MSLSPPSSLCLWLSIFSSRLGGHMGELMGTLLTLLGDRLTANSSSWLLQSFHPLFGMFPKPFVWEPLQMCPLGLGSGILHRLVAVFSNGLHSLQREVPLMRVRTTFTCKCKNKCVGCSQGLILFSKVDVVGSSKLHDFTSPVQRVRFLVPGLISLFLRDKQTNKTN